MIAFLARVQSVPVGTPQVHSDFETPAWLFGVVLGCLMFLVIKMIDKKRRRR